MHAVLGQSVPAEKFTSCANSIAEAARAQTGHEDIVISRIQARARSFKVTADIEALEAIAKQNAVECVLPAEVEGIYPEPVRRRDVEE